MKTLIAISWFFVLSACMDYFRKPDNMDFDKAPQNLPVSQVDSCGAKKYQSLIGQDSSMIEKQKFDVSIRVEKMGYMYTQEYSAKRLRIRLDENGKIIALLCG